MLFVATTVASTMRLASMVFGMEVFVTGGIGGVHRGGEDTLDISADLIELSKTPMIVVLAGIKSILDISRTLEQLETLGVPTACYTPTPQNTTDFPAFFSASSGIPAPHYISSAEEVALAFRYHNYQSGMLIVVPNPHPSSHGDRVSNSASSVKVDSSLNEDSSSRLISMSSLRILGPEILETLVLTFEL